MPQVKLHGPLKQLAGGAAAHDVEGATVRDALRALEAEHPALAGWVLDERGHVRRHINVFVNGDYGREETTLAAGDHVEILPAISGG